MNGKIKLVVAVFVALMLVGLVGCKSDEEKMISHFEDMANIIDSNKDDCDKMGEELAKWADKNGAEMKKLASAVDGKSEEEQKQLEEKYGDRMEKAMVKMMGGLMACMDNEKVESAMEKLDDVF